MRRAVQRKAMRLARRGPGAFADRDELRGYLWRAAEAKPGWRSRNWIMSQEWFDLCLERGFMWPTPGVMCGIHITVDPAAGIPRIERYVRASQ